MYLARVMYIHVMVNWTIIDLAEDQLVLGTHPLFKPSLGHNELSNIISVENILLWDYIA